MARRKSKKNSNRPFGEMQAVAYVRIGGYATAGMADTGSPRSVIAREIAAQAQTEATGRRGRMNIAGHRLSGDIVRVNIEMIDCPAKATVDALVPDKGQRFPKGLLLGMDFLQGAGLRIDATTGEAYCSEESNEEGKRR